MHRHGGAARGEVEDEDWGHPSIAYIAATPCCGQIYAMTVAAWRFMLEQSEDVWVGGNVGRCGGVSTLAQMKN